MQCSGLDIEIGFLNDDGKGCAHAGGRGAPCGGLVLDFSQGGGSETVFWFEEVV